MAERQRVHGTSLARSPSDAPAGNERRNGQAAASTRCAPLCSMVFKISNDSIVICRYPSDTAPWDSAMDRGNLADLTAFVLADQASFLCEGTSRQWVNRVILTERRSLPLYPDKQTISEPVLTSQLCQEPPIPRLPHARERRYPSQRRAEPRITPQPKSIKSLRELVQVSRL